MCMSGCSDMGGRIRGLRILSLGLFLGWGNSMGAIGNINDLMGAIVDFSGYFIYSIFLIIRITLFLVLFYPFF
jgi:hypothetical protein